MQARVQPDALQHLGDVVVALPRGSTRPCTTGASPTMSTTRMRGLSEAYGSWKIICTARRSRAVRRAVVGRRTAGPSRSARPSVGVEDADDDAPERRLAAAGFADQARPPRPRATARSTSSTACTVWSADRARRARRAMRPARSSALHEALGDAAQLEQRGRRSRSCDRMQATQRARRAPARAWRGRGGAIGVGARAQRSRKAQPAPSASSDGVMPGICASGAPRSLRLGTESIRPARVGMQRAVEHVVHRPGLDDAARRTSRTRSSARPATTERSCVIQISAVPLSRQSFCISARICPWMVTSSAVVGSSAMIRSGLLQQRDRDGHALAHAAGELVRIGAQPLVGRGDADRAERLARSARARSRATRRRAPAPPRSSACRCAAPG